MKSVKNAAMARAVPHPIEILLLETTTTAARASMSKSKSKSNRGESVSLCSNVDRATAAMRF